MASSAFNLRYEQERWPKIAVSKTTTSAIAEFAAISIIQMLWAAAKIQS
jgi:hypothetical protein